MITLKSLDEVVLMDFEFRGKEGERRIPVCLVWRGLRSGIVERLWLDEVKGRIDPPFPCGPNVAICAYYASAELGCFLALDWPFPRFVIDLYPEFRVRTNGLHLPHKRGLYGAMRYFGHTDTSEETKEFMRERILKGPPYTPEEPNQIMDYCEVDVNCLAILLPELICEDDNLIPVLWRGEYMKIMAQGEFDGIPIDGAMYRSMKQHWRPLRAKIIGEVAKDYPVFENGCFRSKLFAKLLDEKAESPEAKDWPRKERWPRTPSGDLSLSDQTLKDAAETYPKLAALRQTRQMLSKLR
jgi:hypothetical protein